MCDIAFQGTATDVPLLLSELHVRPGCKFALPVQANVFFPPGLQGMEANRCVNCVFKAFLSSQSHRVSIFFSVCTFH